MHHIINHKWRSITCGIAILALTLGCFCLTTAFARKRKAGSTAIDPALSQAPRTSSSVAALSTTFGAPVEMVKPLSPIFFQHNAEPEIKVDVYGNVYVTAINGVPGGTDLWKSTDKGATFPYLGQPDGTQNHCATLPQCAGAGGGDDSTDISPGGYLYVSSLWIGNVTVSTSKDGGAGGTTTDQAWQVNPAAAAVIADDRMWIAAYGPQTLNMTYRQAPGTGDLFFVKSTDAGKTFGAPVLVRSGDSTEGNLVVDPYNGNLYTTTIPTATPTNINLLKSTDGGATWTETTAYAGPAGTNPGHKFTILAVDRGGNIHLVFSRSNADGSYHVYLTSSADQGASWLAPVQVDSGTGNSTFSVMPWVSAGSPGVVDITWIGSTTSPNIFPSAWYVFFAQTTNALSTAPTFNQVQVLSKSIHDQDICFNGSGCASNPRMSPGNRDLLEYYTMTIDPDGNANIAYPDSLTPDCPATTCQTNTWYLKQTGGPSAYAPPAGPPPSTFAHNIAVGSPGAEPGLKVDSHNCIFVAAPGNPWMWKSVNNGLSFLPPVNPVANNPGNPASGGDEDVLPIPQASGARPDILYFADLASLAAINISESTDGGKTWFPPGTMGAAGQVDPSSDRQWIAYDRGVPTSADLTVYEMDHEAASEAIRFNALTNDGTWAGPASGMTDSELILPPNSTFPNTNPGPVFVDSRTHMVYGIFNASTVNTNSANPPFGKMPNVWEAVGPAPAAAGAPPGPFVNHAVFKGVFDSPTTAPTPPPQAATFGSNCSNDFPSGAIDNNGNIYVIWAMNNARTNEYMIWFAASHDHGNTFYGPFQVSQGPGAAEMPWIAAGDNGRVEIVYYGTSTPGDPNVAPNTTHWNTFFAQSLNANSREPVFTISQASDHVMHDGSICNLGLLCTLNNGDRSLLDFFQVSIGPDGLANIIFADNGSSSTHAEFTRQTSGPLGLTNPTTPTCLAPTLNPLSAVSRKVHGTAGTFDVNLPLTGTSGIECRTGGPSGNHQAVVTFPSSVTVNGNPKASVTSGTGTVSNVTVNGTIVTIDLTGVTNAQQIVITLFGVSDGTNSADVQVTMGVLEGDTTANGAVNSSDIAQTQSQSGVAVSLSNFREDVTVNGAINSSDISMVQSRSGSAIP
jgi:hypothetical protein